MFKSNITLQVNSEHMVLNIDISLHSAVNTTEQKKSEPIKAFYWLDGVWSIESSLSGW